MRGIPIVIAVLVLGGATVSADFSYTQTTRVTGGTLLNMTRFMPGAGQIKEPKTHTIAVKGGKMVTYDADSATIIDATSGHTCSSDPEPNTRPPVASWSNQAKDPNQKKYTRNGSPVGAKAAWIRRASSANRARS